MPTYFHWLDSLNDLVQRRWGIELLDLPSDQPYLRWFQQGLTIRQAFHELATA